MLMNTNIKGTNMELTEPIREYVEKKLMSLEKFIQNDSANAHVEVGKTTNHHKNGDVYKAEIIINVGGERLYALAEKEDLYAAIDEALEDIYRTVTSRKDKKMTLFKRGASSVKKMLKGVSGRNPFTSK